MQTTVTDQMGNTVAIAGVPDRIISLVPSQTELLVDLGLDAEVVGITRYCVHPTHWKTRKAIIGGTKNFDFDAIHNLHPQLIIGNKEENYREGIDVLRTQYPVWMSDISSLEHALEMITEIGTIVNRLGEARRLSENIVDRFNTMRKCHAATVLYLIWRKPWMIAGRDTFIDAMLNKIGLKNAVAETRYPVLTSEQIRELNPDFIMLSSEPFPFSDKHINELRTIAPRAEIMLVDGEMFSWYGSRLQYAPQYFSTLPLPWK